MTGTRQPAATIGTLTPMQRLRLQHELSAIAHRERLARQFLVALGVIGFFCLCALIATTAARHFKAEGAAVEEGHDECRMTNAE